MVDISLEDLVENTDSVYEAVAILFLRARQITDEQKLMIETEMEVPSTVENRDNEDFDDVEIDREALQREYKKYPKPTRVAIEEMVQGKIKHRYIGSPEEEENSE
ncbi:hypothetical protein DRO61_12695 [Candidatus Bathyarchaeota archaeon]|nr:MAG: hypothetical protein DRO61_12695 [Candidatus Bathyarchaeota archaeon]